MSIEAMNQALEALESKYIVNCGAWRLQQDQAITALRQAIAEAEKQEPYGYFRYDIQLYAWVQNKENTQGVAFYTAPPKREWVGLTEDDIIEKFAELIVRECASIIESQDVDPSFKNRMSWAMKERFGVK
jgi:hypothetical protein